MEGVKYCENEFSATLRLQIGKKYNFSYWGWSKYCKNEFQQVFGLEIAENSFLQYLDPLNMKNRTFCQFFCSQNWKFVLTLFDHPQYEKSYFLASKVMRIRSYNILTPSPQYRYENSYFLTIFRPQNCWKFVLTAFGPPSIWKIVIFDNFSASKLSSKFILTASWHPENENSDFLQILGVKLAENSSLQRFDLSEYEKSYFFMIFVQKLLKNWYHSILTPPPPEYAIAKSEKHEPRGF